MKNLMLILLIFTATLVQAQQFNLQADKTELTIDGTSNVHDWTITAEQFTGSANIQMDGKAIQEINSLKLEIPVKGLKSGKSGMDDNTYKALKADKHPVISYEFRSMDNVTTSGSTTTMDTKGVLTIGGVSKIVNIKVTADTSSGLNFKGDITFKMSVFEVEPPTAVFGTIKTGDAVTIKFNAQYK